MATPAPATSLADNVVLNLLERSLDADRPMQLALYSFAPETESYSLSSAVGFEDAVVRRARGELVFRAGEERGLVGLVAATRAPVYVPDCAAEPRWLGQARSVEIRSSYLVPVVHDALVPAVICAMSPVVQGFSPEHRAQLDWLGDFASRAYAFEKSLRARLGRLERQMREVALEWGAIRGSLAADLPGGLNDRLRAVSPREWEVVERLQAGQRVTTIARDLGISPNTVRNHVKAISRKLGVSSQDELREFIGGLHLGARVTQR